MASTGEIFQFGDRPRSRSCEISVTPWRLFVASWKIESICLPYMEMILASFQSSVKITVFWSNLGFGLKLGCCELKNLFLFSSVYAFLGVISTVNQHIIDTIPSHGGPRSSGQSSSSWPLCVSVLKDLETVVEVASQHFLGDDGKWNFIALTEATKVLVRLAQFKDSGYRILLQGGETSNSDKTSNVSDTDPAGMGNPGRIGGYDPSNLEGRALSALNMFAQNAKMTSEHMWVRRTSSSSPASLPRTSLSTLWSEKGLSGGFFVMGEVLCIIRPLVYVLFIRKYGIRSWTPWLVSLAVDLTGVGILSYVTRRAAGDQEQPFSLSVSEKNEMKRRKVLWALYVMRDPFFSNYARNRLETSEKYLHQVPLIGFLTAKIVELLIGAQTRYTYTSGS